ncbi:hypothetical protein K1719_006217 [Acacia pycnantha]|nr:hypothetical protein K1719_006217 [Acacia pycnantha]
MAPIRSTGFVDPGWDHGVAQDERKKKVRCNYCGKIVSGGIYRLKQHLARVSGEVTYCEKAPEDVYLKMKENLEGCRSNKKQKQVEAQAYLKFHSNDEEDEEERVGYRNKGKQLMVDRNFSVNLTPLRSLGYVDPGWEHGTAQDERKKKVKCNYCEKIVSGGINRFKQHLARIPGEVAPCKHAPEEVYLKIKENMKWHRTGKRHRRPEAKDFPDFYSKSDNEEEEDDQVDDALHHMSKETLVDVDKRLSKDLRKNFKGLSPSRGPEPVLRRSRLDSVYLKMPKNQTPQSYKPLKVKTCPTKKSRKEVISTICKFFYHAGVPLQAANSIYFHKMLEVVGQYGQGLIVGEMLRLLDEVVEEIGEENIVQVITENTPSYKAAGKMLEEKRSNLFWTPCATYCIDRMLEDFMKIKCVGECMEKGQKITKLIYNQIWFSSTIEGKEVEKIILNVTFWKKMQYVRKSVDPIMQVLQKLYSGESLSMPYIYNDMYRAKLAIKAIHGDDARKYEPFWKVIDNHWNSLFYHPLYLAAYFLNPSYRYRPDFVAHSEVVRGLNECIVRLEPDSMRRISASMQISDYNSAKADLGTELAISTRTELEPAAWWQQHGISCLELQRIAVRILSQTCSSIGSEHDWSIYDQIYSKRCNRLSQKKLNDLIYVHYNLRLRECQLRKRSKDSSSVCIDTVLQETLLDDWVFDANLQSASGDKVISLGGEQDDECENDSIDYEEGTARPVKECLELVAIGDVGSLDVDAPTDDESDLNYFDDDLSE